MATAQNTYDVKRFEVVHPLKDVPEQKRLSDGLGPIAMTRTVRISLFFLRAYLVFMTLMLTYHLFDLAGMAGRR